jgi:uncharacterized protein
MAKDLNCTLEDLIKKQELRKQINKKQYISETVGEFTINDILKELEKPGRDPREQIEEFNFDAGIKSIEDLKPGMKVPGIVTNITNFGAFVDIGVKQDGLVHVSQLSNSYVSDPNTVVKLQQAVMVTVTEVDVARKRIGLTMKTDAPQKAQGAGDRRQQKETGREPVRDTQQAVKHEDQRKKNSQTPKEAKPVNDFQAKLDALKKKFH